MDHQPFSLEKAIEIAEDFQDLVESDFGTVPGAITEAVIAVPFDKQRQDQFLSDYLNNHGREILPDDPSGYEVLVIGRNPRNPESFVFETIRNYAAATGIPYNQF
jgi:hypothetical protein